MDFGRRDHGAGAQVHYRKGFIRMTVAQGVAKMSIGQADILL